MNYIRVQWLHEFQNYPVWLISELDDDRWEIRKVEVFADGSKGHAMNGEESGRTRLGLIPVPPINEIAADPEFLPEQITKEQFEAVWNARFEPEAPKLAR
jgi:hypothetical protein